MRIYDNEDPEYLKNLNADEWMFDCLKMNPEYVNWGPYEEYMNKDNSGWNSRLVFDNWAGFYPFELDEMNEVVNFYFEVTRESSACHHCDQSGYNPKTRALYEDWDDAMNTGRRWSDKITQDEVHALQAARLLPKDKKITAAEVNAANKPGLLGFSRLRHDALNRHICVKERAERLGFYGSCSHCKGNGFVYVEPKARLGLVLWILHPRKGCSRGAHIKNIQHGELPEIYSFLAKAAERNANRFRRLPKILTE